MAIHVQVILRRVRDQWTVVGGVQDRVVVIIRVDAVGQTIDIGIDKSIIDCPVTVVVQPITSFRRWRAGGARVDARVTRTDGGALSEAAEVAKPSTVPSQSSSVPLQVSEVAPSSGSQVSPAKTPAAQVSTPVLPAQKTDAAGGRLGQWVTGGILVGEAVAVIVGAVAGLGGGTQQRVAGVAGEDAGGAGLDTGIAGAESNAAGGRLGQRVTGGILVGEAVAVIVGQVAGLGRGPQ